MDAGEEEYCQCDKAKLKCKPCYYLQENIVRIAYAENGQLQMSSGVKGPSFEPNADPNLTLF